MHYGSEYDYTYNCGGQKFCDALEPGSKWGISSGYLNDSNEYALACNPSNAHRCCGTDTSDSPFWIMSDPCGDWGYYDC